MTVEHLQLEDLLQLASDLGDLAVRDLGLLEAAVQRPQTTLYGQEAYPSIHDKAAVLLESLARNHALVDGNKRIAWLATVVFYELNELTLDAPDDEAYDLIIAVSTSAAEYADAARDLDGWVTPRRRA
ncbi:type II toxin-antitoxin system death-on-curing family toxin [Lysinimonas soli]|uniref:Type II toxin-antitoxin system death-on-curing family toxin n=1 Tax=Lysinimonas soli TaxID=1074233 RepID=A0ABW0NL06_9MICO